MNMLIVLISEVFANSRRQGELEFWVNRLRIVDVLESTRKMFVSAFEESSGTATRSNTKDESYAN